MLHGSTWLLQCATQTQKRSTRSATAMVRNHKQETNNEWIMSRKLKTALPTTKDFPIQCVCTMCVYIQNTGWFSWLLCWLPCSFQALNISTLPCFLLGKFWQIMANDLGLPKEAASERLLQGRFWDGAIPEQRGPIKKKIFGFRRFRLCFLFSGPALWSKGLD